MKLPKKGKGSKKDSAGFDFESFQKTVVSGLKEGKGLLGESGLLKPLIANFVESALSSELDSHIEESSILGDNRQNKRNGKQSKKIRSEAGEMTINYSRDRNGTFEPVTVGKRQHELAVGFDSQILELYAMSNSLSDIRLHLEKMYGAQMSESRISSVINGTWETVKAWHERPSPVVKVPLNGDAAYRI